MKLFPLTLTYDDVLLLPHHGKKFDPLVGDLRTYVTKKITVEAPIIASGMPSVTEHEMAITLAKMGGVGVIHPFLTLEEYSAEISAAKRAGVVVGASVGDLAWDRVKVAVESGADFLAIDAAHGDSDGSLNFLKTIKKEYPKLETMAGCFATPEGVLHAIQAGADSIRVGIGPGSHCTTRVVSGVGYPQFTAIQECFVVTKKYKVPLIAECGIRTSGDIVKALAAGASAVMIGGLFAGTIQSPGEVVYRDGKKYKESWGYCSTRANHSHIQHKLKHHIKVLLKKIGLYNSYNVHYEHHVSEGVEHALIPYKGNVEPIIQQLKDGVRSGFAYTGATDIASLQKNASFVQITNAGLIESFPHDIILE